MKRQNPNPAQNMLPCCPILLDVAQDTEYAQITKNHEKK
jgi:hypothetical protein